MGLLTITKKQKAKDKELRCLVLGLDNSGKTTIVYRLLHPEGDLPPVTPTIGFQIHTLTIEPYNLQLWDIGGQSTLRPFWENYFDSTDLLLWCVDAAAASRVAENHRELYTLLTERDRLGLQCAIVVLLNKVDLLPSPAAVEPLAESIRSTLAAAGSQCHVTIMPCSALSGSGLASLPQHLRRIYSNE
ncbi:ADR251Wp [Eremothecium gossypii ATCC 10895]|uniref:ADR251Wp n=1 Tax=Eremothecium gossypii (strain ATCC 10895 / CBS 109.51 / FGSC 9923 / NRRL Y-1056) TaxID=284811 RepID=Q759M5_EREGS|nr:ADR251Wp [Eremothecium gossypii ATCC 10895]AAS52171.2 ADR251Wp [Eremothecium gossypii ATCC 10895]AEY96470.1 FADR251Wp [Eremothecium gossypii FDAG1]